MENKKMLIGLNVFDGVVLENRPGFALTIGDGKAADYAVCHFDPNRKNYEDAVEDAKKVASIFKKLDMDFVANFEFQNFGYDCKSPDGFDWSCKEGGVHRLNLPPEYIAALAREGNLAGIEYDEFEHCIINRNLSIEMASKRKIKPPVFALSESDNLNEQKALLESQLKEFAGKIKDAGSPALCGEHIFPVLFHIFASCGIIPNFKSQKESCSNIQFAIAGGAALQYGIPLWNCVDSWYRLTNPGHSPEELYSNLEFAYYAGVNRVYAESCSPMEKDGALTPYGKKYMEFCGKYRGKERSYDISDYTPEICIIRQDDSFWGQNDPLIWKKMLYGNKKIKPDKYSKEYIRAIHLVTHGKSFKNSISWDNIALSFLTKHRSFLPMNSTAVFDDTVGYDALKNAKLCFLCGRTISENTLSAVSSLVKENGTTAVTPKRFLPEELKDKAKGKYCEIEYGKGKYIVTDNLLSGRLKKAVKPFIGNSDEIRLTFGNEEIRLKISADGNTIERI